jgi:lipopolysaccharide export system permease protein
MRILDRYITTTFIATFVAALCIFFSLYVIIDLFGHLDEILKSNFNLVALRAYYIAFIPKIFVEMAPIASLLAIVYTLSRLNTTNEIIAMRSSGLSIWQITKVVLITGLAISCLIFYVNEKIVPASQYKLIEIKTKQMGAGGKYLSGEVIRNAAIYGLDNRLFFISLFNPRDNTLSGIVVFEQDDRQNILAKIVASTGEYKHGHWIFYDCITYTYTAENQLEGEPQYVKVKEMDFKDTPHDIEKQQLQISYMGVTQLKEYRRRLSSSYALKVLRNFDVEIQRRFAFPLSTVILMLVSIPFSLSIRKKGHIISSFGIAIGLGFLYYVFNSVGVAFGKEGFLPVDISAWLANAVFFLAGLILIRKLP